MPDLSRIDVRSSPLDYTRTKHLVDPGLLASKRVVVVGLGSGGAPVCDHLTMAGVQQWDLFDPDVLDPVNLVKHPRMRRDLGMPKVEIQKEWILDRNPEAKVNAHQEDVFEAKSSFHDAVTQADLVLSATDTRRAREFINDVCVKAKKPMVVGSVFRTGIGGEVFRYLPRETGCYRCLQLFATQNGYDLPDDVLDLTPEEEDAIYGLGMTEFRASGLAIDIAMIALIHARVSLATLLRGSTSQLPPMKANWIIFGNRPHRGVFTHHFESKQMLLKRQNDCNCPAVME